MYSLIFNSLKISCVTLGHKKSKKFRKVTIFVFFQLGVCFSVQLYHKVSTICLKPYIWTQTIKVCPIVTHCTNPTRITQVWHRLGRNGENTSKNLIASLFKPPSFLNSNYLCSPPRKLLQPCTFGPSSNAPLCQAILLTKVVVMTCFRIKSPHFAVYQKRFRQVRTRVQWTKPTQNRRKYVAQIMLSIIYQF